MMLFHNITSKPSFFSCIYSDTARTDINTLSLHDALPISSKCQASPSRWTLSSSMSASGLKRCSRQLRSEEHTSELQSRGQIVCRLLLEKKKIRKINRL